MGLVVNGQERSQRHPVHGSVSFVHQLVDNSWAACLTTRQCVHRTVQKVLLINLIKSVVQIRTPGQWLAAWAFSLNTHVCVSFCSVGFSSNPTGPSINKQTQQMLHVIVSQRQNIGL